LVPERIAEQRIAEAMGQRAFDAWPGRGRQLDPDDDAAAPPDGVRRFA